MRDIEVYTLQQWGREQWESYEAVLHRALETLGATPDIGRARDDLRPGYRAYLVEQHVILYRVTATAVIVSRIVHGRMDARRALRQRR